MIQSEWIFLRRVTTNMLDEFAGVETMIQETFPPCLFFRKTKSLSPIVGALSKILVKKSSVGFLNIVTSENEKYLSFQRASAELIQAMPGGGARFPTPVTYLCSGKKGMMDTKTGLRQ